MRTRVKFKMLQFLGDFDHLPVYLPAKIYHIQHLY